MISPGRGRLSILLAEDDLDDQELLAEALAEVDPGVSLRSFSTGRSFLAYLGELPDAGLPDLMLLDYNIPEINGAGILEHLQTDKRYQDIVKLVWSTSNSYLYENTCLALGAKAYLVKPSNVSGLVSLARTILDYIDKG